MKTISLSEMKKLTTASLLKIQGGDGITNPPHGQPCPAGFTPNGANVFTLVSCFCILGGPCFCVEQRLLVFDCV